MLCILSEESSNRFIWASGLSRFSFSSPRQPTFMLEDRLQPLYLHRDYNRELLRPTCALTHPTMEATHRPHTRQRKLEQVTVQHLRHPFHLSRTKVLRMRHLPNTSTVGFICRSITIRIRLAPQLPYSHRTHKLVKGVHLDHEGHRPCCRIETLEQQWRVLFEVV